MEQKKAGPVGVVPVTERPAQTVIDPPQPSTAMVPARPGVLASREGIVQDALQGILPSSIGEVVQVSAVLAKSKAVPKYLQGKPDTVFAVVLAGLEIGLTPMRACQNLQNIHGNLGMKADLQLALVRKSGLMIYFDEGYEEKGVTDGNLLDRAKDGKKIQAKVAALPQGKPYGWTTMQRKGDAEPTTVVFSWADAERAFTYEKEDDDEQGRGTKKKLSEKFNFTAWPMDMYPKRSRTRCIALAFSDVTAGIPSIETLQDRAIEGEIIGASDQEHPDADDLLQEILDADEALGQRIMAGFEQLKIAGAKKLQKLVQYRGTPNDLLKWLQDEFALQRTGNPKQRADVLTQEPAKPAAPVVKPWAVRNDSQRPSFVDLSPGPASSGARLTIEPGQTLDLDIEPEAFGRGVVVVRQPEAQPTQETAPVQPAEAVVEQPAQPADPPKPSKLERLKGITF